MKLDVVEEPRDLATVVAEYGLSTTKAQAIVDGFADVFEAAARWEKAAREIVVTDESQTHLMAAARSLRLEIRARRIDVEHSHKAQKKDVLREGRAIDGIANVLTGLMVPLEKYLGEQENYAKLREQKRDEARRAEAERLLIEQEERAAAEAAEAEAKRLAEIEAENARLKVEAEKREKAVAAERAKAEKARIAEQKKHAAAMAAERAEREEAERVVAEEVAKREKAAELVAHEKERIRKAGEQKAQKEIERRDAEEKARREKEQKQRAKERTAHEKALADARAESERLAAMVRCPECGHVFDGRTNPIPVTAELAF